jgi:hypothetical protein
MVEYDGLEQKVAYMRDVQGMMLPEIGQHPVAQTPEYK